MDFSTIKVTEPEPGIALVTLNRPDRLNAINLQMLDDLHTLFDCLQKNDQVRILVITGEGRAFCSGADISDEGLLNSASGFYSDVASHLEGVQKRYSGVVTRMRRLPQPIISAVNGHAAGGGMCIALASDVIIAGPDAKFTPSFINIGLSGGEMGSSYFLPRMVGIAKAAEILLTGRTIDAFEADKIGMVSRLSGEGELINMAMEQARIMLGKTKVGLRLTKAAINQNLNAPSFEAAIELEDRNQSILNLTTEFSDAVKNFAGRNTE